MTELPEPMTPANCDLRGYEFMPVFGGRLFGSRFYARALRQPRAGMAAFKLWWTAWQQCPAGSLPDDDGDLAMLADFGTDLKAWKAVRELALHGFVKCSDGRLYHPVIAAEAMEAFGRRIKERERKAGMRAAKTRKVEGTDDGCPTPVPRDNPRTTQGRDADVPRDNPGTSAGQSADVRADRTGQDRTVERGELTLSKARDARPRPPLPDWLPVEAWNGFLEMRRRQRRPPTAHAVELLLGKLDKFRQRGVDVVQVLDQSTISGWAGLFEPREERRGSPRLPGRFDAWDQLDQRLERETH